MVMEQIAEEPQEQPVHQTLGIIALGDADQEPEVTPDVPAAPEPEVAPEPAMVSSEAPELAPTTPAPTPEPQVPDATAANQQQEIEELHRLRQANAQKEWETQMVRKAQALEQRAMENGADPQTARVLARQSMKADRQLREQEDKALELIGYVEGRQNAALHFMKKYKMIPEQSLKDIQALLTSRTPADMEQQAKTMATFRQQKAEIDRLKQGRVAPQTFDNGQGSAEVTSNKDRLLDAYIAGDRSDAAIKAARDL